MSYVFITPSWFFLYSVILELFFALITLTVSIYAFKIYRLTEDREPKLFGTAFLFISIAYFLQSILNALILSKLDEQVIDLINLQNVAVLNLLGIYVHALFFIIGILILTYVTLKIENVRAYTLLLSIVLLSIFFSTNKVFMFYVLSAVLLIHIVIYYFMNYASKKKTNTLIVLVAMIFLLFSTLHFMLALNHEIYYVLGHVLEFIAYMLILINLLMMLQHDKKKR